MTTIKVDTKVRDELSRLAESDYDGVTLGEALRRLMREHRRQRAIADYERLREDPEEWESYLSEAREIEQAGVADLRDRLAGE